MTKKILSEADERFIRDNYRGRPIRELTKLVCDLSGRTVEYKTIRSFLSRNHLACGVRPSIIPWNTFPSEHTAYIKENYRGVGPKEMTARVNEQFGTDYTVRQIKAYYKNHDLNSGLTGHFEKGSIPYTAGKRPQDIVRTPEALSRLRSSWFRKGNVPHNHEPVGTITVREGDRRKWVKVAEPNVWKLNSRVVWEREKGPIPKNYVVTHRDNDPTNDEIENLMLITKAQHHMMNKYGLRFADPELTETGANIASAMLAVRRRRK